MEDEIKDFQIGVVTSSVAATGFIITEANFGTVQRLHLQTICITGKILGYIYSNLY